MFGDKKLKDEPGYVKDDKFTYDEKILSIVV